jgi:hypothetical protein
MDTWAPAGQIARMDIALGVLGLWLVGNVAAVLAWIAYCARARPVTARPAVARPHGAAAGLPSPRAAADARQPRREDAHAHS